MHDFHFNFYSVTLLQCTCACDLWTCRSLQGLKGSCMVMQGAQMVARSICLSRNSCWSPFSC